MEIRIFLSNWIAGFFHHQYLPTLPSHTQISWNFFEVYLDNPQHHKILFVRYTTQIHVTKTGLTNQIVAFFILIISGRNQCMSPDFLHMVITQRKDKSVTNIFNWVWLGIPNHTKIVETFHGKGSSKGWSNIMDSSKSTIRFYFQINRCYFSQLV